MSTYSAAHFCTLHSLALYAAHSALVSVGLRVEGFRVQRDFDLSFVCMLGFEVGKILPCPVPLRSIF